MIQAKFPESRTICQIGARQNFENAIQRSTLIKKIARNSINVMRILRARKMQRVQIASGAAVEDAAAVERETIARQGRKPASIAVVGRMSRKPNAKPMIESMIWRSTTTRMS